LLPLTFSFALLKWPLTEKGIRTLAAQHSIAGGYDLAWPVPWSAAVARLLFINCKWTKHEENRI
jgi:hypothetical protein